MHIFRVVIFVDPGVHSLQNPPPLCLLSAVFSKHDDERLKTLETCARW